MQSYSQSMANLSSQQAAGVEQSTAKRYERNGEKVTLEVKVLTKEILDELKGVVSDETRIITREWDRSEFDKYARVFNGSIQSPACAVVLPTLTGDVSE